ncbi:MAG: hypothetical protein DRQ55_15965 [Planctomycetota bacterium]|nr:MAG: hypothetical protein DRQ55_15965 [Planctomycetota bacterium]
MVTCSARNLALAGLLFARAASAQQAGLESTPLSGPRLIALTTDDAVIGAAIEVSGRGAATLTALGPTNGARHLRRFGQQVFAVHRDAGTILRLPLDGDASQLYDLGSTSEPMDVLVAGPTPGPTPGLGEAWVTRRHDPRLLLVDLESGVATDSVDLSPVGGGSTISLGTMARHGSRLFVQVRISDTNAATGGDDGGVLAVVDLDQGVLLDVDGQTPGVQGVALQGAPPRFKMQIVGETLFVSTTDSTNDVRGGIERVDLTTLTSTGYAVSEANGHSDMGGFVMLDEDRGYYVFHTDLLTSTHLVSFTSSGGPEPGSLIDLLGDTVDVLVHDPARGRVYLPSGGAFSGHGLYAFSTETNAQLGPPLDTRLRPFDVVFVNALLPSQPGS